MSRTITESPDKFMHDGSVWSVEDPDAYTFIYRVQDELLFKAKSETREHKGRMFHFDMVRLLTMIGKIFRDESWYAYDEEAEDYRHLRWRHHYTESEALVAVGREDLVGC